VPDPVVGVAGDDVTPLEGVGVVETDPQPTTTMAIAAAMRADRRSRIGGW
jgi:hypothetical protein